MIRRNICSKSFPGFADLHCRAAKVNALGFEQRLDAQSAGGNNGEQEQDTQPWLQQVVFAHAVTWRSNL